MYFSCKTNQFSVYILIQHVLIFGICKHSDIPQLQISGEPSKLVHSQKRQGLQWSFRLFSLFDLAAALWIDCTVLQQWQSKRNTNALKSKHICRIEEYCRPAYVYVLNHLLGPCSNLISAQQLIQTLGQRIASTELSDVCNHFLETTSRMFPFLTELGEKTFNLKYKDQWLKKQQQHALPELLELECRKQCYLLAII